MKSLFKQKSNFYFEKFFLAFLWYNWIFFVLILILNQLFYHYSYSDYKERFDIAIFFNKIFSSTFFDYNFYFLIFDASNLNFLLGFELANSLSRIPILNICFALVFLVALISYTVSNKKKSRLLTFCVSVITICLIIKIFKSIFYYIYFVNVTSIVFSVKFYIGNLLLILFYFKLLRYLRSGYRLKSVDLNVKEMNSEVLTYDLQNVKLSAREQLEQHDRPQRIQKLRKDVVEASKFSRFIHFILDYFLLIICFSSLLEFFIFRYVPKFESEFIYFLSEFFKEDYALYILLFVWSLLYYLFFESIFKITPAKILTGSVVLSAILDPPLHFAQLLGRTCSRFIPFNSLSFLFGANWHDKISLTVVVREEKL